jgi:hypothetical protein
MITRRALTVPLPLAAGDQMGLLEEERRRARHARPGRRFPWRRARVTVAAVLLFAVLGGLAWLGSGPAGAAGIRRYYAPVCGSAWVPVDLGQGDYATVANEPDGGSCVRVQNGADGNLSWYVSYRNSPGRWEYPNLYYGLFWGRDACLTHKSALGRTSRCMLADPVQVKSDGHPLASVTYWPHLRAGNVSFDLWFNKEPIPRSRYGTFGQADGAEVMIWLDRPGAWAAFNGGYVTLQGRTYGVHLGIARGHGKAWNYVAFIAVTPTRVFSHVYLNYFFRYAEGIHSGCCSGPCLSPDWWLTSVHFGSEMLPYPWVNGVENGTGFAVKTWSLTGLPTVAQTRYGQGA